MRLVGGRTCGAALVLGGVLAACSPPPDGGHWSKIGLIPDGPTTIFVEIEPGFEKTRKIYDDAVRALCSDSICRVLFFGKGDPVPNHGSLREFIDSGGFSAKPTLAVWVGNKNSGTGEFNGWDCNRAGSEGAPLSALCGEGIKESFKAVGVLASMAGIQRACSWPSTNDIDLVNKFVETIEARGRKAQFKDHVSALYGGGYKYPDRTSECDYIQRRNAKDVSSARSYLTDRLSKSSQGKKAP